MSKEELILTANTLKDANNNLKTSLNELTSKNDNLKETILDIKKKSSEIKNFVKDMKYTLFSTADIDNNEKNKELNDFIYDQYFLYGGLEEEEINDLNQIKMTEDNWADNKDFFILKQKIIERNYQELFRNINISEELNKLFSFKEKENEDNSIKDIKQEKKEEIKIDENNIKNKKDENNIINDNKEEEKNNNKNINKFNYLNLFLFYNKQFIDNLYGEYDEDGINILTENNNEFKVVVKEKTMEKFIDEAFKQLSSMIDEEKKCSIEKRNTEDINTIKKALKKDTNIFNLIKGILEKETNKKKKEIIYNILSEHLKKDSHYEFLKAFKDELCINIIDILKNIINYLGDELSLSEILSILSKQNNNEKKN